ncbi:MAG: hypothetical protein HY744_14550 [Deltaproteobacteria bacterium]|nr:hypothetical protein [Deltaproteobacteria bacterium]
MSTYTPASLARLLAAALAATSTLGCSLPAPATPQQLQARAAFDLRCPPAGLQLFRLGPGTAGAAGCGRQAAYVEQCHSGSRRAACRWVLDGPPAAGPAYNPPAACPPPVMLPPLPAAGPSYPAPAAAPPSEPLPPAVSRSSPPAPPPPAVSPPGARVDVINPWAASPPAPPGGRGELIDPWAAPPSPSPPVRGRPPPAAAPPPRTPYDRGF